MSAFLAFLAGLPSAFWTSLTGFAKSVMNGAVGAAIAQLWDMLQQSKRMNEQLYEIIKTEKDRENVERQVSTMSDSAVMDELRTDYGPDRRANRRTGQV